MKIILKSSIYWLSISFLLTAEAAAVHETEDIKGATSGPVLPKRKIVGVGAGIVQLLNAYDALKEAQTNTRLVYKIYEKNENLTDTTTGHIVPSLTFDEIISVVPPAPELVASLEKKFSEPGGIRVDDVPGINNSPIEQRFIEAVQCYSKDEEGHKERTNTLLKLGYRSMAQWQELYDKDDPEFRAILEASNFNPCREPRKDKPELHDGYRIDLISNVPRAAARANKMKERYEALGSQHCRLLSPQEVITLDPSLEDFCQTHAVIEEGSLRWKNDSVALWRPGGCIDTREFLPRLCSYLTQKMGTYPSSHPGVLKDCFKIKFGKKVVGVLYENDADPLSLSGLTFSDGSETTPHFSSENTEYLFCPGEAVGTLTTLGLQEPPYVRFAGVSLMFQLPKEGFPPLPTVNHCMEVHQEGIVLAWQAREMEDKIFMGVAGTKAFYGDQEPNKEQEFAQEQTLLQFKTMNKVSPQFLSVALGRNTKGQKLDACDMDILESNGIVERWVGSRAVVYDGFPVIGYLYRATDQRKIENASVISYLGSGGVSFAPAAVAVNAARAREAADPLIKKVLYFADSRRVARES